MTQYRSLSAEEYPAAVKLWTDVFRLEDEFFTSLIEGGEAKDNLSFAAIENGEIVSSVHVFMRLIRDTRGVPLKVGGIGSVSTHPDHRKKGHSGRLLELAIKGMEDDGCVWSFLGTGVNDHYARYGWRTVSTPDLWGTLRPDVTGKAVELTPDDATLRAMAELYEKESASRPMATVRTERTWQTAIRYRLGGSSLVLGSYEGVRLAAYLVARAPWGKWGFVEAAGNAGRFPDLFAAAAKRLQDTEKILFLLPPDSPALAAFKSVVKEFTLAESRSEMVRPIAGRISWPELFALYGDPRGRHCDLDAF